MDMFPAVNSKDQSLDVRLLNAVVEFCTLVLPAEEDL